MKYSKTFFLILINILAIFILDYLGTSTHAPIVHANKLPNEITLDNKYVSVRGAVQKEGEILIRKTTTPIELVELAGGFLEDANIKEYLDRNTQESIYLSNIIIIPFKSTKLFINYSTIQQIAQFFNIDSKTATKISSNKPFLSYKQLELTLQNLGITKYTDNEVIL